MSRRKHCGKRQATGQHKPLRQSGLEDPLNPGNDFVVVYKFAAVKLCLTFSDFLPEPLIVINTILDQLLNHLLKAASTLGGHPVELGFQLGCKVHFHKVRSAVA
jgi:hypothetical protein